MSDQVNLGHKLLGTIEHVWPYIVAFFTALITAIKIWWIDKKQTKARIHRLEIIAESFATRDELHSCRDEVREDQDDKLDNIYSKINEVQRQQTEDARANAEQHQNILTEMSRRRE